MSDDQNPFQAPLQGGYNPAGLSAHDGDFYVREGLLFVRTDTQLPAICVETGEPVEPRDMKTKTFVWTPAWLLILLFLNLLILLLVYLFVKRPCKVTFGLQPDLRAKYRQRILIKCVAIIGSVAILVGAAIIESGAGMLFGILCLFVSLIYLFIGRPKFKIASHNEGVFGFKGCSPEFLRQIENITMSSER